VAPQPRKALSGMFVNAFESVIVVKLVQLLNENVPMLVTEFGIITDVNFKQF